MCMEAVRNQKFGMAFCIAHLAALCVYWTSCVHSFRAALLMERSIELV